MFELTLSIDIEKQKLLNLFHKKLASECDDVLEAVVCHNHNGRTFLAVAVNDSKKEILKTKILAGIVDIIVDAYKYEYFKQQLSGESDNVLFEPFLKAITIFDKDCDFEVVKNEINLSGEILIDSFFYFRLQSLSSRWEKTAGIIIKNGIAKSQSSMIQVIKFLVESSENFTVSANIKLLEKSLQIKNYKGRKLFKVSDEGFSKFLTELICLNPLKINLSKASDENLHQKSCQILTEIFGEKIYFQN